MLLLAACCTDLPRALIVLACCSWQLLLPPASAWLLERVRVYQMLHRYRKILWVTKILFFRLFKPLLLYSLVYLLQNTARLKMKRCCLHVCKPGMKAKAPQETVFFLTL